MSDHAHLKVKMLSSPRYLGGVRDLVAGVARSLGFTDAAKSQIALAVDEALCNVINHGYSRAADKPIWVSVWPLADDGVLGPGIKIVIEDEAKQVEPEQIKSRDLADIRPGGLGVHIIRETMDEAVYEKRPTAGMKLTIVKRHRSPKTRIDAGPGGCGCDTGGQPGSSHGAAPGQR